MWARLVVLLSALVLVVSFTVNQSRNGARTRGVSKLRMKVGLPALQVPPIKPTGIKLPEANPDLTWGLGQVAFSLLPLAPGPRRKTIFEEVVKNQIFTMDQIQGEFQFQRRGYCSMLLVSCVIPSGAMDSSGILLSYSVISLA